MNFEIFDSKQSMGQAAAKKGAACLEAALTESESASMILATGISQFETLEHLLKADLHWPSMTGFHLDEYIGISDAHEASFQKYLRERFVSRLPAPLNAFHYIKGDSDPSKECKRIGNLISQTSIDVAFVGVGENGHLAFNDPPADLETPEPYLIVNLDEDCRNQQLGEGWFPDFQSVPTQAISMSIQQIMKSKMIICTAADERKAAAVRKCFHGEVTPQVPASILKTHKNCHWFLDTAAAAQL